MLNLHTALGRSSGQLVLVHGLNTHAKGGSKIRNTAESIGSTINWRFDIGIHKIN